MNRVIILWIDVRKSIVYHGRRAPYGVMAETPADIVNCEFQALVPVAPFSVLEHAELYRG